MKRINTSRQTIAATQRNCNYHSNGKPSTSVQALMVKIDWTNATVVKIQARRDFTLQASTVAIIRGEYSVLRAAPASISAGMILYFVASDGFPGWYYLCIPTVAGDIICTCPQCSKQHNTCKHSEAVTVGARPVDTDRLWQARKEREYSNLSSVA